ncbi:MAG: endopeptidase La [Elusimicrobia bacterium GWA2_69_24]|nr:MAG: endopeptidase La [Elusimicrobia bacterium GWA2_69_24]
MSEAAPSRRNIRPASLPVLAVRDVVIFPHMVLPLSVGRQPSIKALELAMASGKLVAVTAQKKASITEPGASDLYHFGVLAEVVQYLRMPEGTLKVFLQGIVRVKFGNLRMNAGGHWEADLEYPEEQAAASPKTEALMRQCVGLYEQLLKITRRAPPESSEALAQIQDPSRLADTVAANSIVKIPDRQALLELLTVEERLERLVKLLNAELEILGIERKIHTRVRSQIQKTQKEYYLTEQMKAIQKELRQKDDFAKEIDEVVEKITAARMPKAALEASLKEVRRLEKMMPFSPEATVCRSYLDWMVGLPWSKRSRDSLDLKKAKAILDRDHFGLEKAKDRILEYLAVCQMTKKLRGPILCFVGPPGVGKTSLGRSIANSMNRNFVRVSLGGVRDEAEIRGHRRTYIGSLPGRIIQSMRKAKTRNPVFLLDEIDKMGMDWRGDPAAALLEVLDPEQNSTFTDHYLDTEFDLSSTLFICTANTLEGIPVSLQDRLEVIRFSGYTYQEKLAIAAGYLVPKQAAMHGLKPAQLEIVDGTILRAVQEYTREAGVRSLEREIATLCRRAARQIVEKGLKGVRICADNLHEFLGIPKFAPEDQSENAVGVATGLAWTEIGGTILVIEALSFPGKGLVELTGKLGSVMQESARAALSYLKSVAESLDLRPEDFTKQNFHIHVPEGAIPKEGPSAGIAIATAIASQLTGRPVLPGIAMTGEITLRGRVLPIGGLKEKVMAAHRLGLKTVLFPELNKKDLEDIPKDVQAGIELIPVGHVREVFARALAPASAATKPKPRAAWKGIDPKPPKGEGNFATPQA